MLTTGTLRVGHAAEEAGDGRQGFQECGSARLVSTAEVIRRQQYLPLGVAEGAGSPPPMYLGDTQFRIHGPNDPFTVGKKESSGCVTNEEFIDLYGHATLGAEVVLPDASRHLRDDAARSEDRRMPPPPGFGLY